MGYLGPVGSEGLDMGDGEMRDGISTSGWITRKK